MPPVMLFCFVFDSGCALDFQQYPFAVDWVLSAGDFHTAIVRQRHNPMPLTLQPVYLCCLVASLWNQVIVCLVVENVDSAMRFR